MRPRTGGDEIPARAVPFSLVGGRMGRTGVARAGSIPACLPLVICGCPDGLERCVYLRRAAERPHGAVCITLGPVVAFEMEVWLAGDHQGRAAAPGRVAVAVQRAGLGVEDVVEKAAPALDDEVAVHRAGAGAVEEHVDADLRVGLGDR